jgi:hypothetical protein
MTSNGKPAEQTGDRRFLSQRDVIHGDLTAHDLNKFPPLPTIDARKLRTMSHVLRFSGSLRVGGAAVRKEATMVV